MSVAALAEACRGGWLSDDDEGSVDATAESRGKCLLGRAGSAQKASAGLGRCRRDGRADGGDCAVRTQSRRFQQARLAFWMVVEEECWAAILRIP